MKTEFMKGPADNGFHFQQDKNVTIGNSFFFFMRLKKLNIIMIIISFKITIYLLVLRETDSICSKLKLTIVPEKDATLMFCLSIAVVCPFLSFMVTRG